MADTIIAHNAEELDALLTRTAEAQLKYSTYTQEQVDAIFHSVALASNEARFSLAKMAREETEMGVIEDKVVKNNFASEIVHNKYKNTKTCGVIEDDEEGGVTRVAEPIGIIGGILPCTNPTSTLIYNTLLALKTRNAVVFAPHPRAKACSAATAELVNKAAVKAGAPNGLVGCIGSPTLEMTGGLIKHPKVDMVLATGGPGMINAAYTSGKPAVTGGAGNTPAVIHESADIEMAVNSILMSKTFDNGLICASEQGLIVVDSIYDQVKAELIKRGCHIMNEAESKMVTDTLFADNRMNAKLVGQTAHFNAKASGFDVPTTTRVLVAEIDEVQESTPLCREKLCPVLAMYRAKDYDTALDMAVSVISMGGLGHTSCLYVNTLNEARISEFQHRLPAGRVLVNTPSTFGAIGQMYNFQTVPGLTIACGSWGGNATSEVVGPSDLLNIKTVSHKRENMLWFRVPPRMYFKAGILGSALRECLLSKKVYIVTDAIMVKLGFIRQLTDHLNVMGVQYEMFTDVAGEPSEELVRRGVIALQNFQPEALIAFGGGSAIDACKMMRLLYEQPELKIGEAFVRFMDIRRKVVNFKPQGTKVKQMIMIPTTSGTGAEVTPFAVISSETGGVARKFAIADYTLTPDVAIIDPSFSCKMPQGLTANTGLDALTHALEAHVSVMASDYTKGLSLKACQLIFKYLGECYDDVEGKNIFARERLHNASAMAGMAFANAFLGINHSLAHAVGGRLHLPHGLCNAVVLPHVIDYNSHEAPTKMTPFAQYTKPSAAGDYAEIAIACGFGSIDKSDEENTQALIKAVRDLTVRLNIPTSFQECKVDEAEFMECLDQLSEVAFDDQCTGCNPRFPIISEMKELFVKSYYPIRD